MAIEDGLIATIEGVAEATHAREIREKKERQELLQGISFRQGKDIEARQRRPRTVADQEQDALRKHGERFLKIDELLYEKVLPEMLSLRKKYAPHAPIFKADRYEGVYDHNAANYYQSALLLQLPDRYNGPQLFGMHVVAIDSLGYNPSESVNYYFAARNYAGDDCELHVFDAKGIVEQDRDPFVPIPRYVTPPRDIFQFEWTQHGISTHFGPSNGLVAPSVLTPSEMPMVTFRADKHHPQSEVDLKIKTRIAEAFLSTGLVQSR